MEIKSDKIIFSPQLIDLSFSPIRKDINEETYILGAFNPGMCRLPNGNILIMVRVAEALKRPIVNDIFKIIRKDMQKGYVIDNFPANNLNTADPRKYEFINYRPIKVYGLTSLSWLLPVELSPDGQDIIKIHYNKIIEPQRSYQEYGVEDARITKIENRYHMTTCSVSSERHCTTLYTSENGLDYQLKGIILDHQNKDMVLFPEKIKDTYFALTRPLGNLYFNTPRFDHYNPGPSINLATSPDLLHWRPTEKPFIRAKKNSLISMKLGGGAPPIATDAGWLVLFHGVEQKDTVGIYRTFLALLERKDPGKIKYLDEHNPILESNYQMVKNFKEKIYLKNIIFTSGIIEHEDHHIVASGELDLCCRLTHISNLAALKI
jgi:predicted GH43/DUF377 family glycosyl hydrolase